MSVSLVLAVALKMRSASPSPEKTNAANAAMTFMYALIAAFMKPTAITSAKSRKLKRSKTKTELTSALILSQVTALAARTIAQSL